MAIYRALTVSRRRATRGPEAAHVGQEVTECRPQRWGEHYRRPAEFWALTAMTRTVATIAVPTR
jgi:hypothetical protein